MTYRVQIERLGGDGCPSGPPVVQTTSSENEAIGILRRAVLHAAGIRQPLRLSVYAPDDRLLVSYVNSVRDVRPPSAEAADGRNPGPAPAP